MPVAHQGSLDQTYKDMGRGTPVNVAPPVLNQWYTVLEETNVHISWMNVRHVNTVPANKTIEVRFTFDGIVYAPLGASIGNNVWEWGYIQEGEITTWVELSADFYNIQTNEGIDVKDALIEVRMTSAPGTNEVLEASAQFQKLDWTTI